MRRSPSTNRVTSEAKTFRSTVNACPPGTLATIAASSSADPIRRSSSFKSHGAVFSVSLFKLLLQTNSANSPVLCAAVSLPGRIS